MSLLVAIGLCRVIKSFNFVLPQIIHQQRLAINGQHFTLLFCWSVESCMLWRIQIRCNGLFGAALKQICRRKSLPICFKVKRQYTGNTQDMHCHKSGRGLARAKHACACSGLCQVEEPLVPCFNFCHNLFRGKSYYSEIQDLRLEIRTPYVICYKPIIGHIQ